MSNAISRAELLDATARQTTEAAFQEQLRRFCLSIGIPMLYFHVHDSRHSAGGFPDTFIVPLEVPDIVLVPELKRVGGQPTAEQCEWLEALDGRVIDCRLWNPTDWPEVEKLLLSFRGGMGR